METRKFKYLTTNDLSEGQIEGIPIVQNIADAISMLTVENKPIVRYEFGNSMMPILRSGQFCLIKPLQENEEINIGDSVFCNVDGYVGTHMVILKSATDRDNTWYLIGTSSMHVIGWTDVVYGKATGIPYIVDETNGFLD